MRTQVQKWGNSLALRIPSSFASESNIGPGTTVELTVVKGRLVVSPLSPPEYSLEALLSGVTKRNIHDEIDAGPAQGKEFI